MGLFIVPKGVIATIDRIRWAFLWGGVALQMKFAWVRWEVVCRPRQFGGLGVVDFRVRNLAMIAKWAWRYATDTSSL
ncbi:hypothetical protein GQ457_14G021830 [Hibiscus cannabinus]